MASELCMNCFSIKGQYSTCPFCGYIEGTPPKQPHYLMPGTILGDHFIVGTAIGVGGFGITYKCFDTTLGVVVAVKEFYPIGLVNRAPGEKRVGLMSGDKDGQYRQQLVRFMAEARSIAQFGKAKDIVNVYDYFEENNTAYIIMEYIEGVLLKDYLEKQGRMDIPIALSIIEPIIEAVKKIHAQGIIHRDVSPDNIFIAGENSVKLFDFGAARLNDDRVQSDGEQVIKVGYSAPEQYRDTSNQSYYTDIYSVGAILYQMVTGIKPPESTERESSDAMKSPKALGIPIEDNLDRAIMEAMAVWPEWRCQSIQQLDDAIHGKAIAEYPEDKIRRQKTKRVWIAISSVVGMVGVIVMIILINTGIQGKNEMFEQTVAQGTTVEIWVDNADTKIVYDSIIEQMKELQDGDSEKIRDIKEQCREVTYNVTVVEEMEKCLENAKVANQMPAIFVTDTVQRLKNYGLVSMKDTVYKAIDPDDYLFMSSYLQYYPDATEIPTGVDVLLLYTIGKSEEPEVNETTIDVWKESSQLSECLLKGQADPNEKTIPLDNIIQANLEGKEKTYMTGSVATELAILKNPESFDYQKGKFQFGESDGNFAYDLLELLNIRKKTMANKWKKTTSVENVDSLYGNSFLAGTGFRKKINTVKINGKTLPYEVYVPTVNKKMLATYENKLAVSSTANESELLAAEWFIYFALGQQGSVENSDTPYPISLERFSNQNGSEEGENAFENFFTFNSPQQPIKMLVQKKHNPCLVIAGGSGSIQSFGKVCDKLSSQPALSIKDIEQQCEKFQQ